MDSRGWRWSGKRVSRAATTSAQRCVVTDTWRGGWKDGTRWKGLSVRTSRDWIGRQARVAWGCPGSVRGSAIFLIVIWNLDLQDGTLETASRSADQRWGSGWRLNVSSSCSDQWKRPGVHLFRFGGNLMLDGGLAMHALTGEGTIVDRVGSNRGGLEPMLSKKRRFTGDGCKNTSRLSTSSRNVIVAWVFLHGFWFHVCPLVILNLNLRLSRRLFLSDMWRC